MTSKFHKPNDPAFNLGERWYAASDRTDSVVIIGKQMLGEGEYEVNIFYARLEQGELWQYDNDAWNFQVRYVHGSDLNKECK